MPNIKIRTAPAYDKAIVEFAKQINIDLSQLANSLVETDTAMKSKLQTPQQPPSNGYTASQLYNHIPDDEQPTATFELPAALANNN